MPSYADIYTHHVDRYDDLVRHEDRHGAVGASIDRIFVHRPKLVIELGCGTRRVTRVIAARADRVRAYDGSAHMIERARACSALGNVAFGVADNASLPEADGVADSVIAGWTVGHVTGFFPDAWREHARRVMGEMMRVARAGANVVIFETMGTCVDAAAAPNERLAALYAMFEEHGFRREVIDTSYEFASAEEAASVLGFFFGAEMEARVRARGSGVVPEWTGVFHRRVGS